MCLFHVFLVPCFFRYISNYTAENTHTHTRHPAISQQEVSPGLWGSFYFPAHTADLSSANYLIIYADNFANN